MFALRTKTLVMFDRSIFHKNWKKINETPAKRAGLYVMKAAQRSIRKDRSKSKRPSKPGRPPKTRAAGEPMRRIYSVPYGRKGGVIVGAVKLRGKSRGAPVPGLHEHGLDAVIDVLDRRPGRDDKGRYTSRIAKRPTTEAQRRAFRAMALASDRRVAEYNARRRMKIEAMKERKRVNFPKRPFMGPALERSLPRLPKMWAGSIR